MQKLNIFVEDRYIFIESLLKFATNSFEPSIPRIQAFRIIAAIRDSLSPADSNIAKTPALLEIEELLVEYGRVYGCQIDKDPIIVKTAAFSVFDEFLEDALELFKKQPQNSLMILKQE